MALLIQLRGRLSYDEASLRTEHAAREIEY